MPLSHLEITVSHWQNPYLLLCIFFTCVLSWGLVIPRGAILSPSLWSKGSIFSCTSGPEETLGHPSDFLLFFPQEKSPFSKMHAFTLLLLLITIFLSANKPPHVLAILVPTSTCSPFLFLSYIHVSAEQSHGGDWGKRKMCAPQHTYQNILLYFEPSSKR